MSTDTAAMRVWVGCLGCYNAGALVGTWVDAVDAEQVTVETLAALIPTEFAESGPERAAEILAEHQGTWHPAASPHEELWCMDLDNTAPFITAECSPHEAAQIAEQVAELPADQRPLFGAWLENRGGPAGQDWAELIAEFGDQLLGEYDAEGDHAYEMYESELAQVPEGLRDHIDWVGIEREWWIGGDITVIHHNGKRVIFRSA